MSADHTRAPWTDDHVQTAKKMWIAGQTATVIAQTLGRPYTRNSVQGKLIRLGFMRSPQDRSRHQELVQMAAAVGKRKQAEAANVPPRPVQGGPPVDAEPLPPERPALGPPVGPLDLENHHCRWPIGDPRDPAFGFCGRRKVSDGPYCREHAQIAYTEPPPKRRTANQLARSLRRHLA